MLRYIAAVCLLIVPALGVGLGSNCANDGACDVANSMCMKYTTCDMGMCKCKTGYMMTNNMCKEMKAYDEACDGVTSYCTGGTTCKALSDDMSKCKCPTDAITWSPKLKMCSNMKAKGEMCTNVTDCLGGPVSTSCTMMDGSNDKKCMCKAGYMAGTGMYMYMCILPSLGETCTTMCMGGSATPNDPSDDLTCDTNKCTCPTTYEMVTMLTYGPMVKACIKVTENNYADGNACTMNSDCDSYNCAMCPGAGSKTCLSMRTANAATTTRGAICMMLIGVIVSRFF